MTSSKSITTRSGTRKKPAGQSRAAAAKAAPAAEPVLDADEAMMAEAETATGTELDKKELIERVVERCGVKKRDAKPAIEAALAILGEALAEGRELKLEPLGKLKVTKIKEMGDKRMIVSRLRQNSSVGVTAEAPVPDAAE